MADARRAGGVIELVPQVGDFVATGEPLFALYGGAVSIANQRLRSRVAFGPERTMEQDPLFAFRIVADVALKALSPAINDPTTGVLALDQLNRLLRVVGRRRLRGETIADQTGAPRVICRTPNWEDFVYVSCTEIRACGASNVQIARRLRAMLDNLVATLPRAPPRRARSRTPPARSVDYLGLRHRGGSGTRRDSGRAGAWRIVGVTRSPPAVKSRELKRGVETKGRCSRASRTACSRSEASRALMT